MAATQLSSNVKADMKRLSANLLWVKPDDVLYVAVGEGGLYSSLSTPQIAPCAKKTQTFQYLKSTTNCQKFMMCRAAAAKVSKSQRRRRGI